MAKLKSNWHEFVPHWKEAQQESIVERVKLKPITENQKLYFEAVHRSIVTFCVGPAGTGKTYIACGLAAQLFNEGKIKKIVITRPLVTCSQGKSFGWLPGSMDEKVSPYMRPLLDAFEDFYSANEIEKMTRQGQLEMWPLDFMRGASIRNAVIICDEAQNAEFSQLHMLLTRFAVGTKLIITGDPTKTQTDINLKENSNPLREVTRRIGRGHKDISLVELTRKDIVRHPLIQWIDERLSDEIQEEWFDLTCPKCKTKLWYEGEETDFARCYHCNGGISLFDGDVFKPTLTKKKVVFADTFPLKP